MGKDFLPRHSGIDIKALLDRRIGMRLSAHWTFVAAFALSALSQPNGGPRAQDVPYLCRLVRNDDRVRPIPITLIPKARELFEFSAAVPDSFIQQSTTFRCMNGKVFLCNTGANLVCGKASASRSSPGAAAFCKANPDADSVPMVATGHDTIYEWRCNGKEAVISGEIATVDARGFISENWRQIP